MDGFEKAQTFHDHSLISLFKSSPSSSSSSCSFSSSSSSSWTAEYVLQSLSPVRTGFDDSPLHEVAENEAIQSIGFLNDIVGQGRMEWKEVEKRFDRVAWTGGGPEPVVAWSEFGFFRILSSFLYFAREPLYI